MSSNAPPLFDRFFESARRVIFFSVYEATNHLAANIRPHHILLGILREKPSLFELFHSATISKDLKQELGYISDFRKEVPREKPKYLPLWVWRTLVLLTMDVFSKIRVLRLSTKPLSPSSKRVVLLSREEADILTSHIIGPEHLLLGILREADPKSMAALLSCNIDLEKSRKVFSAKES